MIKYLVTPQDIVTNTTFNLVRPFIISIENNTEFTPITLELNLNSMLDDESKEIQKFCKTLSNVVRVDITSDKLVKIIHDRFLLVEETL